MLEMALFGVTSSLKAEFECLRHPITQLLIESETVSDRNCFRDLIIHAQKLEALTRQARLIRDCIDELLEYDMHLATKFSIREEVFTPKSDSTTAVLLLSDCYSDINKVVQTMEILKSQMYDAGEV